ncbi:MAG: ABC transporter ATP-binding protein [Candidatus Dormibacteraeota bacterium]|nr:ABC transporter ATP-binding protein [Candidatus Dormibacteraeota bacterium]
MTTAAPAAPVTTVVVADELRKTYSISRPPREVLRGVSLQVERGEFVALMGPSGCGKSTLLHILGGLEPPDGGTVTVEGRSLYNLDDGALSAFRRDRIGFVFQFFNLLPNLTAAENVALPLRLRNEGSRRHRDGRVSARDISDRVALLMDQLNLHGLQGHGPEEISGGEQQRVAIARALAAAPALLLADEPTGNLDWTTGHEVMALLGRLCRSQQQTAVLVTHDARVAAHADRVLVMRDGEVVDEVTLSGGGDEAGTAAAVGVLVERLGKLDL